MASDEMLQPVLIRLMQAGEIEVFGEGGGEKQVDYVNPTDNIKPGISPYLFVRSLKKKV